MAAIYVSKSLIPGIPKDYSKGVFAGTNFKSGDAVEICPVLLITEQQELLIRRTVLNPYPIKVGARWMFLFGYGCLYNHSTTPNVEPMAQSNGNFVVFFAVRDISKDEELCWDYSKQI